MLKYYMGIHKTIALAMGAWFFLLIFSGVLLVYKEDIMSVGTATSMSAATKKEMKDIFLSSDYQACSNLRVNYHESSLSSEPVFEVVCDQKHYLVNAAGQPVADRTGMLSFFDFVFRFHLDLLVPNGRYAQAVAGILLIVMSYTGLQIWFALPGKTMKKLTFKSKAPTLKKYFDIHKSIGAWLVFPAFLVFTFGIVLAASGLVTLPLSKDNMKPALVDCDDPASCLVWWESLHKGQEIFSIRSIRSSDNPLVSFKILSRPYDTFWAGPKDVVSIKSGEQVMMTVATVETRTTWGFIRSWMYPLHTGQAFPYLGKAIIFVVGVGCLALMYFGFSLWYKKRQMRLKRRIKP